MKKLFKTIIAAYMRIYLEPGAKHIETIINYLNAVNQF